MTDVRQTNSPPHTVQISAAGGRGQDFKDIYTNNTRVGMSPWDVSITFALSKEMQLGNFVSEDQAVVRMSPQQFKTFVSAISLSLQAWEEVFGTITVTSPTPTIDGIRETLARMKEAVFRGSSSASSPRS
jgi:Protein of unknown function (DUF3467)